MGKGGPRLKNPWRQDAPRADTDAGEAVERTIDYVELRRAKWLSEAELNAIEREHPDGISSDEIVGIFISGGFCFSKSTLAKWIQIGLLPQSERVAKKSGRKHHGGSTGMYPASIVRRIQEIKNLMLRKNMTIEEIMAEYGIRWQVEVLAAKLIPVLAQAPYAAKRTALEQALAEYLLEDPRSSEES